MMAYFFAYLHFILIAAWLVGVIVYQVLRLKKRYRRNYRFR